MLIRLVTCELALLDAAIDDPSALGRALGCTVAEGWNVFPEALGRTRDAVAVDVAAWPRRPCTSWSEAFAAPAVQTVVAHTLAQPGASERVLEKSGFVYAGEVFDDEVGTAWCFRLDRARR